MLSRFENDEWLYDPNLFEQAGCVIQADGIGFEPEAFLQHTTFDKKLILFHGKLGFPDELKLKLAEVEASVAKLLETTFLLVAVSKAEAHEVRIAEAAAFFERYRIEVQRLQGFPQVENVTLKFMSAKGESPRENLPDDFIDIVVNSGVTGIIV